MIKSFIDVTLTVLVLAILAPVILLVVLAVWLDLGLPVFFTQQRSGMHGKPFDLIKFRTMKDAYDDQGDLLPDDVRLTCFGRFLRSTSLDELPELWNVLKRDMSLVGPRPLLMEYLPLYNEDQMRRHEVHPGITGWAQVNGRNAISWDEKFKFDVWYVDNRSLLLDLKILCLTFYNVILRQGITAEGSATAEKFQGNP